jgi:hypothetical protein
LKRGEFCYVLNARQMGKSSLLVKAKTRLEQEGFRSVIIDMTNIGSEQITPAQWYKGIVGELWSGFGLMKTFSLKTWWQQRDDRSLLQKLGEFITELLSQFPDERLFIFIDEIDSVLSLPFSVDDFFALIRSCYNQRSLNPDYQRLTFAIFGVATPSDLIQDRQRTPFNIGTAIKLAGFELPEAYPLAQGLALTEDNGLEVLKAILNWTGGQPFLTQKLCQLVVSASQDSISGALTIPRGAEPFWVKSLVESHIIDRWESQDEPEHLRTIRDRLLHNEQRTGRLLSIYRQILQGAVVEADDSQEHTNLLLSGLVVKHNGRLQVKNPIYSAVFNLRWVEKQLAALRPYAQAIEAWMSSHQQDVSRLLQGQALKEAQTWAYGKSLSDGDYQFLTASQDYDRQTTQRFLEAERTKAVEARLAAEQQRMAQQQRHTQRLLLILAGVSLKLGVFLWLWLSTLTQYRTLLQDYCAKAGTTALSQHPACQGRSSRP